MRTAIGQVIGYSELWLDEMDSSGDVPDLDALKQDLTRIHAAGKLLLNLVNELIDPPGSRTQNSSGTVIAEPALSETFLE